MLAVIESREEAGRTAREDLEIAVAFVRELLGREATLVERAKAERFLSHLTRQVSRRLAEESRALVAQGEQTWRHSREASRRRALERPTHETKMEFVGRLLDAAAIGELDLIADLVPDGVEWHPLAPWGPSTVGGGSLQEFWSAAPLDESVPRMFRQRDEHIVTELEVSHSGEARQLWLVFCFDGATLRSASACADRGEVERELELFGRR